ncbi:MAG: aldehyde ferredoxin oxidoreductase N-terminal domain-containing protein [Candidatus Helarchaeota archaeon]
MFGYSGKIIFVDLNSGKIRKTPLGKGLIQKFIGGLGINIKLAYDYINEGIDPLSPDNPIILGAGPLVGTIVPSTSRSYITTKMPMNGVVGWAGGSMSFGFMLKNAGYDHVVITGRSKTPVYLKIFDENVTLEDATSLWGKDTNQTADELKKLNGNCGVITIGQAGENLIKYSIALVDKISTIGRGGGGAVMGSKNLKGIIAYGSRGIKVSNPKKLIKLHKQLFERIRNYKYREDWVRFGLIRTAPIVPKDLYLNQLKKARLACPSCPIGDKDIIQLTEGRFAGLVSYEASVVNAYALFTMGTGSYDENIKLFDLINRYGLDAITIIALFPLVRNLYKRGIITDSDTDGLELKNNFETLEILLNKISYRQGFGNILADGFNGLIKKYGKEAVKKVPLVKHQSLILDPKMFNLGTMEFEQFISGRGSHDAAGGSPTYFAPGRKLESFRTHFDRMGIPENAMDRIFTPPVKEMGLNVGRLTRYSEDWFTALGSLGICARAQINRFYSANLCAELYSAVTGIEMDRAKLMKAAETSWNLLKIINAREGFMRKDDEIPQQLLKKRIRYYHGNVLITRELADRLLDDYYSERGWNIDTGIPKTEKLKELQLENVINDLELL